MTKRIGLHIAAFLMLGVVPSEASAAPLFTCRVENAEDHLSSRSSPRGEPLQDALAVGASFTLDTLSGVVRWTFEREGWARLQFPAQTATYAVSQQGNSSNDWVVTRRVQGLASNPIDVLRIRTWGGPPRFVWFDSQGRVFRGSCTER